MNPTNDPTDAGLRNVFESLAGQRIPGGCDDCNAYQMVRTVPDAPRVFMVEVYHDDSCPTLARHRNE